VEGGVHEHWVDGRLVATTKVFYDTHTGQNCALLTKAPDAYYGEATYLALTLCNDTTGECDYDWNYYKREAGPVRVNARGQCISYQASMLTPDRTVWLLRDAGLSAVHCS
jgi:hypothetical protein